MPTDREAEYKATQRELADAIAQLKKITEVHRALTPSKAPYCSFCGRGKDEATAMVSGQSVFICDECLSACRSIAEEVKAAPSTASEGLSCSFCGKQLNEVELIVPGPGVAICGGCIEQCAPLLSEPPANV